MHRKSSPRPRPADPHESPNEAPHDAYPDALDHAFADAPAPDEEYPFRSERQMERRIARHPSLPLSDSVPGLPEEVLAYLTDTALSEMLEALALNPLERAVAEMRLAGASVREIAAWSGLKKWRVERALQTVRRRLLAASQTGGPVRHAAGWQEVYLSETRRRGKR